MIGGFSVSLHENLIPNWGIIIFLKMFVYYINNM